MAFREEKKYKVLLLKYFQHILCRQKDLLMRNMKNTQALRHQNNLDKNYHLLFDRYCSYYSCLFRLMSMLGNYCHKEGLIDWLRRRKILVSGRSDLNWGSSIY